MKKVSKSCLLVVIGLVGLCIIGMIAMASFNLCPPAGPWPMPPWCARGLKIPFPGLANLMETRMVSPTATKSTLTDGKESYGYFPASCSLITDPKKKQFCEDWLVGKEDWNTPDCASWGRDPLDIHGGRRLCESRTVQKYLPSEVDIYAHAIWRLEDIDLTPTIVGWGVILGDDEPYLGWLTGPKKAGAQHISAVSIWNKDSWKKIEDLPPELKDAYITGFDGEPLYIQEAVFLNFLDPSFQEWLKEKMKLHIDAGTDGFIFDEHWATSQAVVEGQGPFDDYSLSGFREYLQSKYTAEELKKQGVQDIASFNYRDFLVKNNYQDHYRSFGQTGQNPAPFQKEYQRFLLESSNRIIKELIDYANTYARQKGKTLKFALNGSPLHGTDVFDVYNQLDFFEFEHEWFPQWRLQPDRAAFDAGVPVAAKMKYAQTLGKPAVTMPYGGGDSKWFGQASVQSGTAMLLHQFAEAYANLGYFQYADLNYLGHEFRPDHTSLKAYLDFIREHPEAFKALKTYADVALLRQSKVINEDQGGLDGIEGFSHVLGDANIPYDVVGIDRIGGYRTVLAGGFQWSDVDVEQMLSFVQKGGTLIATDSRFASMDENNLAVNRPALQSLKVNGEHALGSGKFVYFSDDLWLKIWAQRDKNASVKILNAVKETATPNTAPEKVQLLPYIDNQGRLVAHILNYDFTGGDFASKENFEAKIHLPPGFSASGKTLTLSSPDFSGNQSLTFTQESDVLAFTVPSLYIWDVAVLK